MSAVPIFRWDEKDSAILLATSEAARGPEAQTLQARMRFEIDMAADLLESTQT